MRTFDTPWLHAGDRLVLFGDSITAQTPGYADLLAPVLETKGITVIRSGRGGDKTVSALTRLERDVLAHDPTAVAVFLGTNDALIGRGRWADEPRLAPSTYADNLRWILHLCRKEGGVKTLSVIPPFGRPEGDARALFGDAYAPYCRAAREAADDGEARFVPVDIAFAEAWADRPGHAGCLLTSDGVHPNEEGNRILADAILRAWRMEETAACER